MPYSFHPTGFVMPSSDTQPSSITSWIPKDVTFKKGKNINTIIKQMLRHMEMTSVPEMLPPQTSLIFVISWNTQLIIGVEQVLRRRHHRQCVAAAANPWPACAGFSTQQSCWVAARAWPHPLGAVAPQALPARWAVRCPGSCNHHHR